MEEPRVGASIGRAVGARRRAVRCLYSPGRQLARSRATTGPWDVPVHDARHGTPLISGSSIGAASLSRPPSGRLQLELGFFLFRLVNRSRKTAGRRSNRPSPCARCESA